LAERRRPPPPEGSGGSKSAGGFPSYVAWTDGSARVVLMVRAYLEMVSGFFPWIRQPAGLVERAVSRPRGLRSARSTLACPQASGA